MSDKLPQQPQNEEVDLGQLFNAIGKLFERLFSFIGKIFRGLFSAVIYALKPIVNNFKLVAAVLLIAVVLGFISDRNKKPSYYSNMLVKPHFDSKYQLANNVDYFNSLIVSNNLEKLSNIFEIDTTVASQLLGFKLEIGPETQNELLIQYDDYIKSIEVDSTMLTYLPYAEFIKNRILLNSDIFSIKAMSYQNDIFLSLEKGFIKTFENTHSKKLKEKSDKVYSIEKITYETELQRLENLQQVYVEVLKNQSKNNDLAFGKGTMFPLTQEKTATKEYELFIEEVKIRNALRYLEKEKIEENNDYYEIVSGFEPIGTKDSPLYGHLLIFPAMAFILLALIYSVINIFKYIRDYE